MRRQTRKQASWTCDITDQPYRELTGPGGLVTNQAKTSSLASILLTAVLALPSGIERGALYLCLIDEASFSSFES